MRRHALIAMLLLTTAPAVTCAHNVGVDCKLRGDKIEVEAFFDDDTPAIKAKVQVVNEKDELVVKGVTDGEGKWTFAAPPPGKYEVRVDAGAGHRAKKTINVPVRSEVPAPAPQEEPVAPLGDGPTRAEFVSFPWGKVIIGVAVLGILGGGFAIATVLRKNAATESGTCSR